MPSHRGGSAIKRGCGGEGPPRISPLLSACLSLSLSSQHFLSSRHKPSRGPKSPSIPATPLGLPVTPTVNECGSLWGAPDSGLSCLLLSLPLHLTGTSQWLKATSEAFFNTARSNGTEQTTVRDSSRRRKLPSKGAGYRFLQSRYRNGQDVKRCSAPCVTRKCQPKPRGGATPRPLGRQ